MHALVTGAAGFLGSHLCNLLAGRGHHVRALIQAASDAERWTPGRIAPIVGDVLDVDRMRVATRGVEVVFHCAAKLPGKDGEEEVWRVNVDGTENVLGGCVAGRVGRVVYVSTDSVYGDGHSPGATEQDPPAPEYLGEGIYPRSKLEGERLVLRYHREHGLPVSVIRTCLMYGPGVAPGNDILRRWAGKRNHVLIDSGRARISLVYVTDVAEMLIRAAVLPQAVGQCYNVSDGVPHSRREILSALAAVVNRPKRLLPCPSGPVLLAARLGHPLAKAIFRRLGDRLDPEAIRFRIRDHVVDIRKAKDDLGYRPSVSLEEGLRRTFVWFAETEPVL